MQKTVDKDKKTELTAAGQLIGALLLAVLSASYALGALPRMIGMTFAAPLVALLLLRARSFVLCLAAGAYAALATLLGSTVGLILAVFVLIGGGLLAVSVRRGEDRASLCITLGGVFLLSGVAVIGYQTCTAMIAAGRGDFFPYLTEQINALTASLADELVLFLDNMKKMYEALGQEVISPTRADVELLLTRQMSLAPGWAVLLALLLSLCATYLLQLFSLLSDGEGREPLFSKENRAFRLGVPLAVLYLAVILVDLFYRDYTSVFSLTVMNAHTVLVPLFAIGGLSFLPRVLHGMRYFENGRATHLIWFAMFIILCLFYLQYAVLFFGIAYAISILKNAIRSRRNKADRG